MDHALFGFMTGGYILIFLFGLLILDLSIWITKKILIMHLNVFKFKNREKILKKLHKISVDEWFKKRKLLNTIKSLSFIGAIVLMSFTGFYLFTADENVFDYYSNQEELVNVNQQDLSVEITDGDVWEIITNLDNMSVEIYPITGDEVIITRTYFEESDYSVVIDDVTNTITIVNDVEFSFNFFSIEQLFFMLNGGDRVVIEIPESLLLGDITINAINGKVEMRNISAEEINVDTSNGKIYLDSITMLGNIDLETSNGDIRVKNIVGQYDLDVNTSNGTITLDNLDFLNYDLSTSNGRIYLDNLNVSDQDGVTLDASSSNGDIIMNDVYVDDINIHTSNGDIDFYNDLYPNFLPSSFEKDTSNGHISTNVR